MPLLNTWLEDLAKVATDLPEDPDPSLLYHNFVVKHSKLTIIVVNNHFAVKHALNCLPALSMSRGVET